MSTQGLEVAEDVAYQLVKAAFEIVRLLVPKVSLTFGAMIGPMTRIVEPKILALIDKIDGKDNPAY